MEKDKEKVLKVAVAWYRYILRSGESLSNEEKTLFNAVFEMQNQIKDSVAVLNKDKQSHPYRPYEEDDRPTTPAPFRIQDDLISKSKKE